MDIIEGSRSLLARFPMALTLSDEQLQRLGMSDREALIEIACRLFDADKLSLPGASKFAGLSRIELEEELLKRKIPAYRYTDEMIASDLRTLELLKREGKLAKR